MLWLPILIGIVIGGVTTYVVYRNYINKKILEEEARKLEWELKRKLESRISEIIKEGEYNTVKISYYDEYDNKVVELEVRGETIENDVYKGMILTT